MKWRNATEELPFKECESIVAVLNDDRVTDMEMSYMEDDTIIYSDGEFPYNMKRDIRFWIPKPEFLESLPKCL